MKRRKICKIDTGAKVPTLPIPDPPQPEKKSLWELKFKTYYSYKWNSGLYRFWKFWEEAAAVVPVLLSMSVVGVFVDKLDKEWSLILAALSTLLSLFSIVKGFSSKAAFYVMHSKRYLSLFECIERYDAAEKLDSLLAEFCEIEKEDHEEGLDAYAISCYNKTAIKLGVPDACRPLSWIRKMTMCFF